MEVDARGRSCPEPVILTMQAMKEKGNSFDILVDNKVAVENITRCCNSKGYSLEVMEEGSDYRLKITRK